MTPGATPSGAGDERRAQNLQAAVSHPLRAKILDQLASAPDEQLSPSVFAKQHGKPLGTVSYHFRRLASLGLIELAGETHRRGAIQSHYVIAAGAEVASRDARQRVRNRFAVRDIAEAVRRDVKTAGTQQLALDDVALNELVPRVEDLLRLLESESAGRDLSRRRTLVGVLAVTGDSP